MSTLTGTALPECTSETATGKGCRLVKQIYAAERSKEESVPILYDKKLQRIINNESAEIIRMLRDQAAALGSSISDADRPDLYSAEISLREEIDSLNNEIYTKINNGAYKAGFSSDQAVYATAFEACFDTLSQLDARLAADGRPFLTGDRFTEADLRLFPTLYRHDPVYYVRMKLNGAKILDFPNLWCWLFLLSQIYRPVARRPAAAGATGQGRGDRLRDLPAHRGDRVRHVPLHPTRASRAA